MKIGMFGHRRIFSRQGGIDVAVTELSRHMADLGHQVICYDREPTPPGEALYPGIRRKVMPSIPGRGLAAVSSGFFAAVCSGVSAANVIHIHGEGPAFFCPIPRLLGKEVVVTVHGLDWQREKWRYGFGRIFIRWGEQMAVRYAHKIIVLSRAAQCYFLETYGRDTIYIPNGLQKPEPAPPEQIRQQFGLDQGQYLLYLGRLVPEKGVHHLIRAYRQVATEKKLVIAGASSDSDEYVRSLHRLARGDARILFTGFVQGQLLRELYSNAYVYVLPSDVEGMPLSLLEAMGYGCCCLVSDIPECTEVLGTGGLTFPPGDSQALLEKLQLLCSDPMLAAAHRTCRDDIPTWKQVAERTLEVYGCGF